MILAATTTTALTSLGDVFSQFMQWVSTLVTTISGTPLLLLTVGIFCVGATIGLAYRLIRG